MYEMLQLLRQLQDKTLDNWFLAAAPGTSDRCKLLNGGARRAVGSDLEIKQYCRKLLTELGVVPYTPRVRDMPELPEAEKQKVTAALNEELFDALNSQGAQQRTMGQRELLTQGFLHKQQLAGVQKLQEQEQTSDLVSYLQSDAFWLRFYAVMYATGREATTSTDTSVAYSRGLLQSVKEGETEQAHG